jgi:hypothetical protein
MWRERALKFVLVVVGLLFSAGIYPLIGGLLQPADSDTGDTMMMSLYFALGIFLLIAVHRSLIIFAAWSCFSHAVTMSIQASKSRVSVSVVWSDQLCLLSSA